MQEREDLAFPHVKSSLDSPVVCVRILSSRKQICRGAFMAGVTRKRLRSKTSTITSSPKEKKLRPQTTLTHSTSANNDDGNGYVVAVEANVVLKSDDHFFAIPAKQPSCCSAFMQGVKAKDCRCHLHDDGEEGCRCDLKVVIDSDSVCHDGVQLSVVIPLENENDDNSGVVDGSLHGCYLDSNVIDMYIKMLWENLPNEKQESCTYLDCLWFKMYLEEALSMKILNWTKEKHIFSKRYVFIPIVHWGHWNLLILCHFGSYLKSGKKKRCMLLLDSLKKTGPERLEPLIRRFLTDLYKEEGRKNGDKIVSNTPLIVPEVPQQTNGKDCGVFLLQFIDLFLQSFDNFSVANDRCPSFITKNWFGRHEIETRRKHIHDLFIIGNDRVSQVINKRASTRTRKFHGCVRKNRKPKTIDLSRST